MKDRRGMDSTIRVVAILGCLVVVNLLGMEFFKRLDLTRAQQFTLSGASRSVVGNLLNPVTVRAYFSADMPAPYSNNARYVRDLLDEYHSRSDGNFRYEFIDPLGAETEEDKEKKKETKRDIFGREYRDSTTIEKELQELGIPSLQVRINKDDKLEVKRVYMGLAIDYGDETEVIPVVQETASLEYDLTTLIRKMTRVKTPKVAFLTGHDGVDPEKDLGKVASLLTQIYEVAALDLTTEAAVPDDVDTLVVAGPKTPLSAEEQKALDAFVMRGGSVAFLLDSVQPDLQAGQANPADHGLTAMLSTYGVAVESGLVLDAECASVGIVEQRGFMRFQRQVQYPYMPIAKSLAADHPLTRGLPQIAFPFMSPLTVQVKEGAEVKADVLVTSSEKGWVAFEPYNLDPRQEWSLPETGTHNLVVTLSGAIPGHFKSPEGEPQAAENARILVAGGASFLRDQYLSPSGEVFVQNLMDWLLLDEALLEVRSRGLAAAPLGELSDSERRTVKYGNIVGVPLLFILFGLVRWRRREARRSHVTI